MSSLQTTLINIFNDFVNSTCCPICNTNLYIQQSPAYQSINYRNFSQCTICNISAFEYFDFKEHSSLYIRNYKLYPYKSDYYYLLHQDSLDMSNLKINSIHDIISIINKNETFQ